MKNLKKQEKNQPKSGFDKKRKKPKTKTKAKQKVSL